MSPITTTSTIRTKSWRAVAMFAAVGLVILTACSTSPSLEATSSSSSSQPTTTIPTSGPTSGPAAGYAATLRPVLQDLVTSMAVPSAVVLVRSSTYGDASFEFGTLKLGTDRPPTTTDHYRIGSLTKTMTGTVILQLAQEGKLALDDPISKYRPDVPNGDNITIAQLLDMRSGLFGYDIAPEFLRAVDKEPERIWSPDELLAIGYSKPALFPPGTAYNYSNTNYILLGLVMEQVTGQNASELFQQRLFDPLGLDNMTLPALNDASIPADYAHGYMFSTVEKTGSADSALTPEQQKDAVNGTLLPNDWTSSNPSWGWTAGSVISTADDMAVWARAVVDGELLDAAMQAQRLASPKPIDPAQPDGPAYGSGMLRAGNWTGHAGLIFGYNTQFLRDPATDTTIVVLTGLTLAPDGQLPVAKLTLAVIDQLAPNAATDLPESATTTP